MAERCDICGVAALESERFATETVPFCSTKRYCPACRQRLYRRVFAVLALVNVSIAFLGIFDALHHHTKVLESNIVQISLLIFFQWLMVLPHELGHAFAGRAVGLTQIRVIVGAGTSIFSFRLFGFPILINVIPFGGLTLSKQARRLHRRQYVVFVISGLLVNFTATAIAWRFVATGELFSLESGRVITPFFWANVLVLIENLFPHRVFTPYGPLNSDGLQLWNLLFRWNKSGKPDSGGLRLLNFILRDLIKWMGFLVMVGAAGLCIFFGFILLKNPNQLTWVLFVAIAIMIALAAASLWMAVRIAKHPIRDETAAPTASSLPIQSLTPEQKTQVQRASDCAKRNDFAQAEALFAELSAEQGLETETRRWLVLLRIDCIISQKGVERVEKVCLDYVNQAAATEDKIKLLDAVASHILYKSETTFLEKAELLARMALELSPSSLTLQGTLGGVLAEQGRFGEAEPLLQDCLTRSPAAHDQGISALFLAMVKLGTGAPSEAKRLIERGMVLHPEPWLLAKARGMLKKLETDAKT